LICLPSVVKATPTPPPARVNLVRVAGLTRVVRKNGKHYAVHCRDEWRCQYCGRDMLESLDAMMLITVDHIFPKGSGGGDSTSNLATCCVPCNQLKSNAPTLSIEDGRRVVSQRRAELLGHVKAAMKERSIEFPARAYLPWVQGCLSNTATLLAGQVAGIANAIEAIGKLAEASAENHGLETKQPEKRHGENAPGGDMEVSAADACEPLAEPLQSANG